MMPALRADPQGLLELFVPIVGVAARAGVRVLGRVLRGRAAVLDRNVDPARHGRLFYGVGRYRPSAAQTSVSPPGSGKKETTSSSGSRTSESNATYTASTAVSASKRPFSPV